MKKNSKKAKRKQKENLHKRSAQPNQTIKLVLDRKLNMPYAICSCGQKTEPSDSLLKHGVWAKKHEIETDGMHQRRLHNIKN